ncbi:MAG TPA: pyridoxamine 5'-phosphate oxidase family protein [Polyangiaceae bacterium]|jgi:hypothetical protein|nr:pyridoxamine 5'-phosphate oxidase family protein [Polyangiaceae bacterium]
MNPREPFHAGEIAVQERAGEREQGARNGAGVHDFVTAGAARFLGRQRLLAVALADDAGRPWASVWLGEPGFAHCADARTVRIGTAPPPWAPADPTVALAAVGQRCGVLAIDLGTRQRLRINGTIGHRSDDAIGLDVHESFANCPKYIQRRELVFPEVRAGTSPTGVSSGVELGARERSHIERADTLFVASQHPERGLDASHRGGEPGFVRVVGARTLRFPDYPGNSMFQTLGNFAVDPRAGVVVLDFEANRLLSLTGTAKTLFAAEDPAHPNGGSGRYWEFHVTEWLEVPFARPLLARLLERSPFNPPSGAEPLE